MRLVHVGRAEMHVVGGNERQAPGIGQIDQHVLGGAFFRQAVALQFDIEPVGKSRSKLIEHRFGGLRLAFDEQAIDRAARPAGERNQSAGEGGKSGRLTCGQSPGSASR